MPCACAANATLRLAPKKGGHVDHVGPSQQRRAFLASNLGLEGWTGLGRGWTQKPSSLASPDAWSNAPRRRAGPVGDREDTWRTWRCPVNVGVPNSPHMTFRKSIRTTAMQLRTLTLSGMRWSILTNWRCCLAKSANNSSEDLVDAIRFARGGVNAGKRGMSNKALAQQIFLSDVGRALNAPAYLRNGGGNSMTSAAARASFSVWPARLPMSPV